MSRKRKITDAQARAIHRAGGKSTYAELAEKYGIDKGTIGLIVRLGPDRWREEKNKNQREYRARAGLKRPIRRPKAARKSTVLDRLRSDLLVLTGRDFSTDEIHRMAVVELARSLSERLAEVAASFMVEETNE